jgi:nucleoside-diphosphate-sugar epimerase
MRVLLLGASGFIGRSIAAKVPGKIDLTGSYHQNKPEFKTFNIEKLDYLDPSVDWQQIVQKYDCIIIAARANADTEKNRKSVSKMSQEAFRNFIQAVHGSKSKPFVIAINGSLTYGDRGEELITISDEIRPTGYARSYAIAEKPFRDFLTEGNNIALIRAPWVLGAGSWFPMMYLAPKYIPILKDGTQWMSIISVEDLADYVWDLVQYPKAGVLHPTLTFRCRQKEFANIVNQVTSKPMQRIGALRSRRMELQMRESVLASIKLDDGLNDRSENQASERRVKSLIQEIHSGFS